MHKLSCRLVLRGGCKRGVDVRCWDVQAHGWCDGSRRVRAVSGWVCVLDGRDVLCSLRGGNDHIEHTSVDLHRVWCWQLPVVERRDGVRDGDGWELLACPCDGDDGVQPWIVLVALRSERVRVVC